ncbi:MAG: 5-formyltetrahydrofolate cyclo-ligase [Deltaproteobacteria bacterium]|nr:5-formyltetrahydrofolate cyclo-ligase [Deltaproteobacteria bacterium]MBZ0219425.1 5-formyltetrahydrofolate cyclo-ligase [Deltaproteobacteria bacterium]
MARSAEKALLRGELLEERRRLPFEEVRKLSSMAEKRFLSTGFYRESRRIALYSSFGNEVLTDEIFAAAMRDGKEVFYPRIVRPGGVECGFENTRLLRFFRVWSLDELSAGSYELREPHAGNQASDASGLDLIVVPGVAFDEQGGRLGFGKGYYDAALASAGCPKIALAYEFQVVKVNIPLEPHDVPVSAIVTEKRIIVTKASGGAQKGGARRV